MKIIRVVVITCSVFFVALSSAVAQSWTGAISTDWSDPNNWSPAVVPNSNTASVGINVTLGNNYPVLSQDIIVKDLNIGGSSSNPQFIDIGTYILTIGDSVVNKRDGNLIQTSFYTVFTVKGTTGLLRLNGNFEVRNVNEFNCLANLQFNLYQNNPSNNVGWLRHIGGNAVFNAFSSIDSCAILTENQWGGLVKTGAQDATSPNWLYWTYPSWSASPPSQAYYANIDTVGFDGNVMINNRSNQVFSLGNMKGVRFHGNLILSNTGNGIIRMDNAPGHFKNVLFPGKKVIINPNETLPQKGEIKLTGFYQRGNTSQNIDLSQIPGSSAKLVLAVDSFGGDVTIRSPRIVIYPIRDPVKPNYQNTGYVNCVFQGNVSITKTGAADDYWTGGNFFFGNVFITNTGIGGLYNTGYTSSAINCRSGNIDGCSDPAAGAPAACDGVFQVSVYDGQMPGDVFKGDVSMTQMPGAGAINLITASVTNTFSGQNIVFSLQQNTNFNGTALFNGSADQTISTAGFNNSRVLFNNIVVAQSGANRKLNLFSTATNPKYIINNSTTFTNGIIVAGNCDVYLNGGANAHQGNNQSYINTASTGRVIRHILAGTSTATAVNFPTGNNIGFFPMNVAQINVDDDIAINTNDNVNTSYSGFTATGSTVSGTFVKNVWYIDKLGSAVNAQFLGGWWDPSLELGPFDETVAQMTRNDVNWKCVGTNGFAYTASNPYYTNGFSPAALSSLPGVFSVTSDNVIAGNSFNICGVNNTSTVLAGTTLRGATWSQIGTTPSVLTISGTTNPNASVDGFNTNGTFTLRFSSNGYCGASLYSDINIIKTSAGTITGLWSGINPNWFDCINWNDGNIPTSTTNVTLPGSVAFYPNSSTSGFSNALSPLQTADLILQSGSSLLLTTVSGNNIEVSGNLMIEAGTVLTLSGSSTLIMKGNGTLSTITGGGSFVLSNLTINKITGNVLMDRPITLEPGTSMLNLTKGVLYNYATTSTGANILTLSSGNSISSVSNNSYIDGWVRKIGNTAFIFPVGSGGSYKAIEITAPSVATDHFTAKYLQVNPTSIWDGTSKDPSLHHVSKMEYWILDRTNGASSALVTLYWDLFSDVSYNAPDYNQLMVSKWDGTTWKDLGNGGIYPTSSRNYGWVKAGMAATSFSPFTLATTIPANPLPINLISFNVTPDNDEANIDWKMTNLNDVKSFEVQRGTSINYFQKLLQVSDVKDKQNYVMADTRPLTGVSYYRLKIISNSDSVRYSQTVTYKSLSNSVGLTFNVSPNPFNDRIKISLSATSDNINVALFDLTGAQLLNKSYTNQRELGLELDNLLPGVYYLKIKTPGSSFTEKLIKF